MIPFDWIDLFTGAIAERLNVDITTMRLVLSVFLGYPIATVFSLFANKWSIPQRQCFLLGCGVFLFIMNFGADIIHMFIGIFITMLVNYFCFRSKLSVIFAFIFNMAYLLSGSYIYNRGTYDINWTTPYCILCLRLIGITWDLFDASRPMSELSAQQKKSVLTKFPGVLETVSFCFVPTTFISGPQFPMRHYQSFLDGSLRPYVILHHRTFMQRFVYNRKVQRTIVRFSMGLLGIFVLSRILMIFPAEFMLTDEFQQERGFFYRLAYMVVFAQITLFRYVTVWLIGEGACVLLGLGCTGLVHVRYLNGAADQTHATATTVKRQLSDVRTQSVLARRDSAVPWTDIVTQTETYDSENIEITEADHTACASISLGNFVLATNTEHLIAGFNINTNKWMLEYVYKRLRFLGNKRLSQCLTLLFLAVWHGTYSGYLVTFSLEFITTAVESDFLRLVKRSKYSDLLYRTKMGLIATSLVGKLHTLFLLATPLTAFYLLHFKLWFPVLRSVYFVGFIYLLWPLVRPTFKQLFPPKQPISDKRGQQANEIQQNDLISHPSAYETNKQL